MSKLENHIVCVVAGTLLVLSSVPAVAQTYAFNIARTCIQGDLGFNNSTLANLGPMGHRGVSDEGTIVLNAGGTGTMTTSTNTNLRLDVGVLAAGQQAISVATGSCDIAYTTIAGGDLRLTLQNCTYTVTKGRGVGDTGTTSGVVLRARKTLNGELLQLSNFSNLTQEVINYTLPAPGTARRICVRVGTAVRR